MLIRQHGTGDWHEPSTTTYGNEEELQRLIASAPGLLPGVQDGPAAVATEVGVPGVGSADVIVVEADGEITIVECKLAANAEIRRKVVGRIFAYAGGLWGISFEDMVRAFQARGVSLVEEFQESDEWDEESFRDAVSSNLAEGAFRLVIAVDAITDEPKATVLYINRHTTATVHLLALELRRAADHGVEVLIPATYGEESAEEKSPGAGRKWDEPSLIEQIRAHHPGAVGERMLALYAFMRDHDARLSWGRGQTYPSVTARLGIASGRPVSIGFYPGFGVSVNFDFVREPRSGEDLTELLELVRAVPGAVQHLTEVEASGFRVRPTLPVEDVLATDDALDEFKRAILVASEDRAGWDTTLGTGRRPTA